MKFLLIDVQNQDNPKIIRIQRITHADDYINYINGQIKFTSTTLNNVYIIGAILRSDEAKPIYYVLQDYRSTNPTLYNQVMNGDDTFYAVIDKAVSTALNNNEEEVETCSTKLGLIQKDNTCWFHAAINGIILGRSLHKLADCMLHEENLAIEELFQELQSSCPIKTVNKQYILKSLFVAKNSSQAETENKLKTSNVISSVGLSTRPFLVAPGWYANKGIEAILDGLDINYLSINYDLLTKPKQHNVNGNKNSVIVIKPKGLLDRYFTPSEQIPEQLSIFGATYHLDHGAVFIGNTFPFVSHYVTAVYDSGCKPRLYDSETATYINIDWMSKNTSIALTQLKAFYGKSYDTIGIGYLAYVNESVLLQQFCRRPIVGGTQNILTKTKSKLHPKWQRTTRKVHVTEGRGKKAKTVEKTVYKNSKTGELRVRKMVTRNGERKATYVKF